MRMGGVDYGVTKSTALASSPLPFPPPPLPCSHLEDEVEAAGAHVGAGGHPAEQLQVCVQEGGHAVALYTGGGGGEGSVSIGHFPFCSPPYPSPVLPPLHLPLSLPAPSPQTSR